MSSVVAFNTVTGSVEVFETGLPGPAGLVWQDSGWLPDTRYQRNWALYHDGTSYRALAEHVASPETEPGVGADWETVWAVVAAGSDVENLDVVAGIAAEIKTVAGIDGEVVTVANRDTDIATVANRDADIATVAARDTDIGAVANRDADIATVAARDTDIGAVASNDTNIGTVASNIADVATAAQNIADIQAAPQAASDARAWAEGTEPDGPGTKSAKEYALEAADSASTAAAEAERAELMAGSATVNADVKDSTADGIATTAVGDQFTIAVGDELVRYRHDAGGVATELPVRTPLSSRVNDLIRRLTGAIEASPNLLNHNDPDARDDYFVNNTTGNLQPNTDFWASGWIPVTEGLDYYFQPKSYLSWFTPEKGFISGSADTDTANVKTAPAGAAYVRTSVRTSNFSPDRAYVVQGSGPLSQFVPYGGVLTEDVDRMPDGMITPPKTSFLVPGKNLFDKEARTLNAIQSTAGVVAHASYDLSDYIPVEEGKTYQYRNAAGGARFRACFDEGLGNVVAQSTTVATSSYTVPVGSGVRYMRLSIEKARIDDFQVEEGAAPTAFEPFGYEFTDNIRVPGADAELVSTWASKICSSYGDSITAQQAWQPNVAGELGLIHTAFGVGGRQVCGNSIGMCSQDAVDTLPVDTELVLVLGGTNDWAQSRHLGTIDSVDTELFYGALNVMAERLVTRLPTARIVWLTTPYGELPGRVTDGIWLTATHNLRGLTTHAYAQCIRDVAELWGFPVIDIAAKTGFNRVNIDTYMSDDGGHLHPNALGGARISEVCIGALRAIEPLS